MPAAALPRDEDLRLAVLNSLGLLAIGQDDALQRLSATVAEVLEVPTCLITLLDGDTLWFKASVGICAESTAASHSPCLMVIEHSPAVTQIPDLRCEARFAGYPLLAAHPTTYYYAGAPLITSQGVPVGAVSVADDRPRQLSPVQLRTRELLARQTALLLEARAPGQAPP